MGSGSKLKTNSKQEYDCKKVKQRALSPQANPPKNKETLKVKNPVGLPFSDLRRERRLDGDDKNSVHVKSSGNRHRAFVKANTGKEDELVKHMSNLPGYLQRTERGENHQEKALNFGVLDWTRLEKWKNKQKRIPARGSTNALCGSYDLPLKATNDSSTYSGPVHSKAFSDSLPRSSLNLSHKDGQPQGAKPSAKNVIRFQDFEAAPKGNMDGLKKVPWTYKSFGRNSSDITSDRAKRKDLDHNSTSEMGNFSVKSRTNGVSLSQKNNVSAWDGEAMKSIKELRESDIKIKDTDQKIISDIGATHTDWRSSGVSLASKEKLSPRSSENRKRAEEYPKFYTDLPNRGCPGEHDNNVLLLPKELPQNEFSEVFQFSQPKNSKEKSFDEQQSSFSDRFPGKEVHFAGLCSEIPHSCRRPPRVVTKSMSEMMPHSLINGPYNEPSSVASYTSQGLNKASDTLPRGIYAERRDLDLKLTNLDVFLTAKPSETAVLAGTKPNHRFSFSLGRLGRSFSFKESSSVPQLSSSHVSVKSGPVRSEASACLDNSNREKSDGHCRAKSSPLRRLLDPLLKYKAANSQHSGGADQSLRGSLDTLSSRATSVSHSLQNEKHNESVIQALLQLTVKNGIPLFKFVVENDRDVLAATMKNLASSGKDDSGRNYTFYFVNEIKKKSSGWISQGSKRDSCGYVYNVAGQMKVSSSCFSDSSGQNSHCQYVSRECVLLGFDLRQADQEPLKSTPNRELAAIVFKIPRENLSQDGMEAGKDLAQKLCIKCLPEDRFSCNFKENEDSNSITVILPGGVHGPPKKGKPSPLIDRWKSGGSCDCGGWDVGCKLCVLFNKNRSSKIHGTSKDCLMPDDIELFVQGEPQQSRPFFSLTQLKDGVYSIEFNSSLSSLQSFFICVAVLSCKRSVDLSETRNMSEAKVFEELILNGNGKIQKRAPSKYTPSPPPSPVGRV
ncbi:hypothetical protein CJ030_MR2G000906 [Morella rubra]|uniref:DUF3527 domain-containing protein n=1 Tax=Morella rubra TaxID=262757 RepID=A0A6A1WGD5_9ROSI|nr:hypothetical protein CJ030_MR2G000906 [Morella rubra]